MPSRAQSSHKHETIARRSVRRTAASRLPGRPLSALSARMNRCPRSRAPRRSTWATWSTGWRPCPGARTGCATSRCCRPAPHASRLAGLGRTRRGRGVPRPRRRPAVAAPGDRRRGRPRGAARRAGDRHRLGQVAGLPAARADRDPRGPGRPRPARRHRALPRADQGARPGPAGQRARRSGLDVRATTHDGDSSREQRDWARDHGEYVLTNPDMLHRSLLPGPPAVGAVPRLAAATSWSTSATTTAASSAPTSPRSCAGCAGSARRTAPTPTFVLASATVAEPEVAAARLTGLDVMAVTDDASPRGQVALALWEPPFTSHTGENGAPVRRAASSETADLLADLVVDGRAHAGVRAVPARRRAGGDDRGRAARRGRRRRCRAGWRPTAAATCPRSAARSRRRCAAAS